MSDDTEGRFLVCTTDGAIYGRHITAQEAAEHVTWLNGSDPAHWAQFGLTKPPTASVWQESDDGTLTEVEGP